MGTRILRPRIPDRKLSLPPNPWLTFGLALFFCSFFYAWGVELLTSLVFPRLGEDGRHVSRVETPLSSATGVAVDGRGNIYVGANGTSRIHVYSPSGQFLRAYVLRDIGRARAFSFRVRADDRLEVAGPSTASVAVFDESGLVEFHTAPQSFPYPTEDRTKDAAGNVYYLSHSILYPRVLRTTPDGQTERVVDPPLYLWALRSPFPSIPIGICGVFVFPFVLGIVAKHRRRAKAQAQSPELAKAPIA